MTREHKERPCSRCGEVSDIAKACPNCGAQPRSEYRKTLASTIAEGALQVLVLFISLATVYAAATILGSALAHGVAILVGMVLVFVGFHAIKTHVTYLNQVRSFTPIR